jgi:hypothetical protein
VHKEALRSGKHEFGELAEQFLMKGREALAGGHYEEAFTLLTIARRSLAEAMSPGLAWYANGPFQIVSNRALADERLGYWNLCRHDTRMTLFLKNDHMRSYERLPTIADRFRAENLKRELDGFVAGLKDAPPTTGGGWRKAAQTAISLISITGIMASIAGELTPDLREELRMVGIDDMHTSLNMSGDVLEYLPWISEGYG